MTAFGCFAEFMPEYDGMNIQEFCDYCHDNGENIYVVEHGSVVSLANAKDHTYQMYRLWMDRFVRKEWM